jgi:hypothetical protein
MNFPVVAMDCFAFHTNDLMKISNFSSIPLLGSIKNFHFQVSILSHPRTLTLLSGFWLSSATMTTRSSDAFIYI